MTERLCRKMHEVGPQAEKHLPEVKYLAGDALRVSQKIRKIGICITGVLAMIVCTLLLVPASLRAQEFRATISGAVTDGTGAVVPGASIEVKETSTGTISRTTSDAAGQYVVPFLLPGDYTITAKASGFEVLTRTGITLEAQEHPIVNLALTVGGSAQTVTVTAAAPLLDQANANIGEDISTAAVASLPLNGRAPMMLAELSVGVETEAAPEQSHPFDNNNMNSFSIGGTPLQSSEVLMDGSPDETMLGSLAFSPTQDSVSEVTVQPFATDASFGHTIGGVMNQITKGGTNALHGSAYEFSQLPDLYANSWLNDRDNAPIPNTHYNQYGLTAGGPVLIPKVLNGKNKLFWFFAWEVLDDKQPASTQTTVPTDAERQGDFSSLLALGSSYQLYEPMTGTYTGGKVTGRTAVPNNCLTNQSTYCSGLASAGYSINPVALNYLKLYPEPNNTVGVATDGVDNYVSNAPSVDKYNEEFGRMDYNLSAKDHMFFDYRTNYRTQVKEDYFGNSTNGSTLVRQNWGGTFDNVYTLNPSTVFDVRANWTFFYEAHDSPASIYSPTQMGFSGLSNSSVAYVEMPVIKFNSSSFQDFNNTASPSFDPTTSYQFFADVLKTIGKHAVKVGFDGRLYRERIRSLGSPSGTFTFGNNWMTSGSSGSGQKFGADLASFELGLPSTGTDNLDLNSEADYKNYYVGTFVQDDWRVTPQLTLNLGLRYDIDTPLGEKFGRTVNGFNPAATNIASGAAYNSADTATAPGTSTTVTINPSTFNTLGGLSFPSGPGGAPFQIADSKGFFSPRIGFAYNPSLFSNSMVVRGGFAIFLQPPSLLQLGASDSPSSNALTFAPGFSASTTYNATANGYFNNCTDGETTTAACPAGDAPVTLSNPFPGGIAQPTGSAAGASTFLGQTISFFAPNQHDTYSERWNLGVQKQINSSTLAEVIYVGNHAEHLDVTEQNINATETQYLSTNPYYDQNLVTAMSIAVPNPFAGKLPKTASSSFNGTTTQLQNLAVPYPQFGTSPIDEYNEAIGQSWYQAAMAHVEHRASHGLTLTANYTFSKLIEQDTRLNDEDNFLEKRVSPFDHTHHFTVGAVYELPFGQGKAFSFGGNRLLDEIFGGYMLNGIYQFQTGAPIYWSGDIPLQPGVTLRDIKVQPRNTSAVGSGNPAIVNATSIFATGNGNLCPVATQACDGTVFTNDNNQYSFHYRTLPQTMSWVRQDGYNNLDASILKNFNFTEGRYFQLRFETFNTLNHPIFAAPNLTATAGNFGYITATTANSLSRQIQLGGRFVF